MTIYVSRPSVIEAVQWTGDNFTALQEFAGDKIRINAATTVIELLAGKDGAQEWVLVPVGHWLVCQPGDKSDIWPVDPYYFAAKYQPKENP